jgi:Lon protease-like protein
MSEDSASLKDFSGKARLFPLPNLVLFPSVIQPLHIFEPRYRQLLADSLASDRLIALALLCSNWEEDYHKKPPIHSVVCIGRIFNEERFPDGRYNLLLHGLRRARILDELNTSKLYRSARVQLLDDQVAPPPIEQELRLQLAKQMSMWFASLQTAQTQLQKLLESNLPLGTLCDVFAFALPLEIESKQTLLEELQVEERARLLLGQLEKLAQHQPSATPSRKFPPEFSTN